MSPVLCESGTLTTEPSGQSQEQYLYSIRGRCPRLTVTGSAHALGPALQGASCERVEHSSGGAPQQNTCPACSRVWALASSPQTERGTQQQGTIGFSSRPVSNCHDLQLSSSAKTFKNTQKVWQGTSARPWACHPKGCFEPSYGHLQAQPGPIHKVLTSQGLVHNKLPTQSPQEELLLPPTGTSFPSHTRI